jgi:hypothetical protein
MERNSAGLFERFQTLDRSKQLHPIIGCQSFTARKLSFLVAHAKKDTPAARPGITAACAVGEYLNFRQLVQKQARGAV